MNSYCPHYHIDCGQGQCWAVVDNIGRHGMSIADLKRYARPTACNGQEDICEFKKFGVKEKINERN